VSAIAECEKLYEFCSEVRPRLVGARAEASALDAAPQSLNKRVIHAPSFADHTDRDVVRLGHAGERLGGKLRALLKISGIQSVLRPPRGFQKKSRHTNLLEGRQGSARRVRQSMIATRYINPFA
jgi:hypothetical protein